MPLLRTARVVVVVLIENVVLRSKLAVVNGIVVFDVASTQVMVTTPQTRMQILFRIRRIRVVVICGTVVVVVVDMCCFVQLVIWLATCGRIVLDVRDKVRVTVLCQIGKADTSTAAVAIVRLQQVLFVFRQLSHIDPLFLVVLHSVQQWLQLVRENSKSLK